jgi:hypothetical protein
MDDRQLAVAITVLYLIILNLMFVSYHLLLRVIFARDSDPIYF